jgi:hypothetical protein
MSQPGIDDFLRRLGDVVGALQSTPGAVHRQIWAELGPWMRSLTTEAAPKWLGQLAQRQQCHVGPIEHGRVQRCHHNAMALCAICHLGTCLEHAFIDHTGDAICYVCASRAVSQSAQAPRTPPPRDPPRAVSNHKDIMWARKVLKVSSTATADELHTQHRMLSARHHPDRYQTEREKATAEKRFKDVQRAFDILQKEIERRSAA